MVTQGNYDALQVEINNIKDDIKEIKEDSKETNKFFREAIDKLTTTQIQQTEILKTQTDQQNAQFNRVNKEIAELNEKLDSNLQEQKIDKTKIIISILKYVGGFAGSVVLAYLLFKFGLTAVHQ